MGETAPRADSDPVIAIEEYWERSRVKCSHHLRTRTVDTAADGAIGRRSIEPVATCHLKNHTARYHALDGAILRAPRHTHLRPSHLGPTVSHGSRRDRPHQRRRRR